MQLLEAGKVRGKVAIIPPTDQAIDASSCADTH